MKAEAASFREKAQTLLAEAKAMFGIHLNEAAGRTAYLGFHVAQALPASLHSERENEKDVDGRDTRDHDGGARAACRHAPSHLRVLRASPSYLR
jgi:hypothetical protein